MSTAVKVSFEIGHVASLRSKQTPEGFTHDWEVFVRGAEGADIGHFVEKVVFHLHPTFKKARRVVKEPPFAVKESGYAGFMFPIEIYLKNKDKPKKIQFSYDFTLEGIGLLRDRYIFRNPNEEFRKKLYKGGGIPVSNESYYTNPDQESRSRDSFTKQQLVSKPKLSSDSIKKDKLKEHKDEVPHRTSSFENLFGPPIQKAPKVSPDPKKIIAPPVKIDKKEKERSSSDKKPKHEHKENKSEKIKIKEEKDKSRSENSSFRKKLYKGGGIPVSNESYYTNPDQESRSRDSFTEEKQQLVSKPKLSSDSIKKDKLKEHKDEVPHRISSFENLFGPPIQKPPKVSPDPKKIIAPPVKIDKKEKERSSSDKKPKHEHKENKSEKIKIKEEKDKSRSEKNKIHSKEQEKSKDKSSKRPNDRPPSPHVSKKQRIISPVRRPLSPSHSSSTSGIKDDYKLKHSSHNINQKKVKVEEKVTDVKMEKEMKEKKKKEKKSHVRDKERKEKKEHKKESHKLKESPKEPSKEIPKEAPKVREIPKERDHSKDSLIVKDKPMKLEKPINKFSMENLRKTPPPEIEDRLENHKQRDKSDPRKYKHKKKDKKRDESKEKHKESSKKKKRKHDKVREIQPEKMEVIERRETPLPKERSMPEPASPISVDTASQCSSKSGLAKANISNENANSSHSDSKGSVIDDKDTKVKIPSPEPIKHQPSLEPEPGIEPDSEIDPEPEPEPEPELAEPSPVHKEKSKKHKDKFAKREEKRRKRKAAEEERENIENIEHRKLAKTVTMPTLNNPEHGESTGSTSAETKVQDNGVSSTLGKDTEPGDLSPDYTVQLRDLQQRIMKIKNNEDLDRVVNLIAETGRYEVTTQTVDFDLCLLDRSTVQQLIQLLHKEPSKEKKRKHDIVREIQPEKMEVIERRETPLPKERSMPEPASPISVDTASQCSSKSGLAKANISNENANSSHSDSEGSVIDDKDTKVKIPSPEPIKHQPSLEPEPGIEPDPEIEPEPEPEPEPELAEPPPVHKEKSKKHKDKSAKSEEKRRKRKAAEEERENIENIEHRKLVKTETMPTLNEPEHGESTGSTSAETKVQDNGVSSTLGEDAEPGDLSPDYTVQLRDLQQRIMKIKNNEELDRVVNLIAETGRYKVTTQTVDFDLCLLDRSTVQQLIQLVGC